MPQSLSALYVHLVFSTKDRTPAFEDPLLRDELHAYMWEISIRLKCPPLAVGGTADHLHVLAQVSRTITVADWTREVKRVSSTWAKGKLPEFNWQGGYGAFTHSTAELDMICNYIRNQEEHHRVASFKDEFLRLLEEHSIEWDARYVWD
jgi:REP element-mobilizing transposase RayT